MDVPSWPGALESLLEGLVLVNLDVLGTMELPALYRSGVKYRREVGTEVWQTCSQVYAAGAGDCEDLAAWRTAELRRAGEADASCLVRRGGTLNRHGVLWHVLVGRANNAVEDPSRILGMGRSK